jgi:5-methylcytosine-specific restriction endonuclease McrA
MKTDNKIVTSPSLGISLEIKQKLIRFRDTHTWTETCKEFPNVHPETWRRWLHNRDVILSTSLEKEMDKRLKNKTQKRKEWRDKNPDKSIPSVMRLKHPFVVCCYNSNGNFKSRRVGNEKFVKLKPFDLWKIAKKQKCKCAITGLKLTPETVSVDHIISVSNGGKHTVDNLRLVHKDINHMKNHYDDKYFLEMCKLVSQNFKY